MFLKGLSFPSSKTATLPLKFFITYVKLDETVELGVSFVDALLIFGRIKKEVIRQIATIRLDTVISFFIKSTPYLIT